MKFQCLVTDAENLSRSIHPSNIAEERRQNGPSVAEIRRRALEIHIEHGGHGRDLEDYLDDWLQAERELREKYNRTTIRARKRNEMDGPQGTLVRGENRMFSTFGFVSKWKQWYRVLRYDKGFGRLDSVRYGLWLVRG